MARKVRIVYPGAFYHVINRGNYRQWIFESPGARASFLECLIPNLVSFDNNLFGRSVCLKVLPAVAH